MRQNWQTYETHCSAILNRRLWHCGLSLKVKLKFAAVTFRVMLLLAFGCVGSYNSAEKSCNDEKDASKHWSGKAKLSLATLPVSYSLFMKNCPCYCLAVCVRFQYTAMMMPGSLILPVLLSINSVTIDLVKKADEVSRKWLNSIFALFKNSSQCLQTFRKE